MRHFIHNIRISRFRLRIDLRWASQHLEFWNNFKDICVGFSIYWNRFFYPPAWWWFHNNGAVKGVDVCYDFTWNFFIFSFTYTDYGFGRYKKNNN